MFFLKLPRLFSPVARKERFWTTQFRPRELGSEQIDSKGCPPTPPPTLAMLCTDQPVKPSLSFIFKWAWAPGLWQTIVSLSCTAQSKLNYKHGTSGRNLPVLNLVFLKNSKWKTRRWWENAYFLATQKSFTV